jgi:methionine biosynthesis protein MetW
MPTGAAIMSQIQISPEFKLISDWIEPNSRVLDLGCGDGQLLCHLIERHQASGYGMEIDATKMIKAMDKGLNVIHSDLNRHDLEHYFDQDSFEYVIMTQALQVVNRPDELLDEMLNIGKQIIITFPNFGHWRNRVQLMFGGRMPETETLPYHWFDTPNIKMCTFKDFEKLCEQKGIEVVERAVVNSEHRSTLSMSIAPNLMGEVALYKVQRKT